MDHLPLSIRQDTTTSFQTHPNLVAAERSEAAPSNPWRNSFDTNGNFYIADVGQNTQEEIDFQPANSGGGQNYGWHSVEGTSLTGLVPTPPLPNQVGPIFTYNHSSPDSGVAVIGGYVYHGAANDALRGIYIFGDLGNGTDPPRIRSLKYDGTNLTDVRDLTSDTIFAPGQGLTNISSFGQDALGRIYITDISRGEVYRLDPAISGDANLDGVVNASDLSVLALHWQEQGGATWATGDFNDDGNVNIMDLLSLANHWQGTPASLQAALAVDGLPTSIPEPSAALKLILLSFLSLCSRSACRPSL